jgi:hypothetical protein
MGPIERPALVVHRSSPAGVHISPIGPIRVQHPVTENRDL